MKGKSERKSIHVAVATDLRLPASSTELESQSETCHLLGFSTAMEAFRRSQAQ
jgi:hypothetical protein